MSTNDDFFNICFTVQKKNTTDRFVIYCSLILNNNVEY